MRRIVINDLGVSRYVSYTAPCSFDSLWDTCIGVVDDDYFPPRPLGGVIVTNYTRVSCAMHMAGEGGSWATRDFLWTVFHYAFVQLDCQRVFGLVESSNKKALDINYRLGFEKLLEIPGMYVSGPGILLVMERDTCKWLRHTPKTIVSNI